MRQDGGKGVGAVGGWGAWMWQGYEGVRLRAGDGMGGGPDVWVCVWGDACWQRPGPHLQWHCQQWASAAAELGFPPPTLRTPAWQYL